VVILNETECGEKQLFAYFVSVLDQKPDASTLRAQLAATLPQYMLPNAFVLLDQLPLTPNGKLDRPRLPAPENHDPEETVESDQAKNLLELKLIRIWEKLFQRSGIGRNDDFFNLGGHSLQAVWLTEQIGKLLNSKIPIAALFQSPTIASFVRQLTDDNWVPAWSSLVPLQPLGSKPPLFLIHGWGGDVFCYVNMTRKMKTDRPIYGVQAVGLDGLLPRHSTLEEMAQHYVREIRSLQPEGPYHLAGFSLGGWIAYAVAQELVRQQQKVALLGLFDTYVGTRVPPYFYYRIGAHLKKLYKLLKACYRYFISYWYTLFQRIFPKRSREQFTAESTNETKKKRKWEHFSVAASLYRPKFYSGHVDFFFVEETNARSFTFWSSMAKGNASHHLVLGKHQTMLKDENNEALIEALEAALSRVS
jgi:pimeloyl-ACP methyl ester carboxylesterase